MDGSEWLTIPEVAAMVEVTIATVQRWVANGYLPAGKRLGTGNRLWLRWSDVLAFGARHYRDEPRPAWLDEISDDPQ